MESDTVNIQSAPAEKELPESPITVFISYKWQDAVRNNWVEALYRDLRSRGINAKLDRFEVEPGESFSQYMTAGIRESQYVLFVVTPKAVEAVESGEGALAFEMQVSNARRLSRDGRFSIIPIFREGKAASSYLADHRYLDFRDETDYGAQLEELVRWLTGQVKPPSLGRTKNSQSRIGVREISVGCSGGSQAAASASLEERACSKEEIHESLEGLWEPLFEILATLSGTRISDLVYGRTIAHPMPGSAVPRAERNARFSISYPEWKEIYAFMPLYDYDSHGLMHGIEDGFLTLCVHLHERDDLGVKYQPTIQSDAVYSRLAQLQPKLQPSLEQIAAFVLNDSLLQFDWGDSFRWSEVTGSYVLTGMILD